MRKMNYLIQTVTMVFLLLVTGFCCTSCGRVAAPQIYTVSYSVEEGGTIVGEAMQQVEEEKDAATVTAVPNEGYKFVTWSDGVTTATRVDNGITSDLTVTAEFEKLSYTVNYMTDGNGTIQGEASQTVPYGENGTDVTAVPNEGYKFVTWSDGWGAPVRADENVTSNITVTAKFEKKTYSVTYITDGNGSLQGEASQTVPYDENGTEVTAVPNEGYQFVSWSDGITTATRVDKNITSNLTVTANFAKMTYSVTYITDGNGTIYDETNQIVEHGGNAITVTAVPNEGYKFVTWSDEVETATRVDKNITSDLTVTAKFEKLIYAVQYLADGNGTIAGEASQSVEYGESAMPVTAIPHEGYRFVGWSDGVETAERTDREVKSNITVTAEFEKLVYQVNYETYNYVYGTLIEENARYDVIRLVYQIAYGEDTPIVRAYVRQNELGEDFVFLYWSDGVTTEERQDTNITSDLTITAYFGYKVEYKVNGNVGGRIEGNAEQKLLPGDVTEEVTAIPAQGYVFCGWSDLSWETSRSGDSAVLDYLLNYSAVWEYVAYFEPIEKTFKYNYGIASGTPLTTQITLNRNDIDAAKFTVPEYDGYTFCGWYADSDYRVRITTENGRYMYGYAAFSLETDTLYAKWQKVGEETDNHKILLVFVDEAETELYSSKLEKTVKMYSKMTALDYEMSKWVAVTICDLLNEWFDGEIIFEVDSYYTTVVVNEGFSGTEDVYSLFSSDILEVSLLEYSYHNTLTTVGFNEYAGGGVVGLAQIKRGFVKRDDYWAGSIINQKLLQKYLTDLKADEIDLSYTTIETYLHELAHTAENYFDFDYDLHIAMSYAGNTYGYSNILNTIKPYLLGKFEMDGEMCGVPMKYWKHQNGMHVNYVAQNPDGTIGGKINIVGETEDNRPVWEQSYIVRHDIKYGSDIVIEAVPLNGYRFVKWSDGITTAIRHDKNIIAYITVNAIFEKI